MQDTVLETGATAVLPTTTVRAQCAAAFAIGAALIFLVGFSHIDAVHNAAHDTRHSLAFPCH